LSKDDAVLSDFCVVTYSYLILLVNFCPNLLFINYINLVLLVNFLCC